MAQTNLHRPSNFRTLRSAISHLPPGSRAWGPSDTPSHPTCDFYLIQRILNNPYDERDNWFWYCWCTPYTEGHRYHVFPRPGYKLQRCHKCLSSGPANLTHTDVYEMRENLTAQAEFYVRKDGASEEEDAEDEEILGGKFEDVVGKFGWDGLWTRDGKKARVADAVVN